jgi:hypothetical protein
VDIMALQDVSFVFGIFIAPLIAVACFTAVLATGQSGRAIAAVSVLSALVTACFVTYWALWGSAFDEVDAGREVPQALDNGMSFAIGVSAVAGALLLVLGAVLAALSRRTEPTHPMSFH